jgi:hypothetical protein
MVADSQARARAGHSGQPPAEESAIMLPTVTGAIPTVISTAGFNIAGVSILADVSPNSTGLPGIGSLSNIVGALLTIGLIACVAGLVIAAIVWAIGTHSSNPYLAGRGKSGVLVAFVAAILIGGANVLVDFFVTTGKGL